MQKTGICVIVALAALSGPGCAQVAKTAMRVPFEATRLGGQLTLQQARLGIKVADSAVGLMDHTGEAIHRHRARRARMAGIETAGADSDLSRRLIESVEENRSAPAARK